MSMPRIRLWQADFNILKNDKNFDYNFYATPIHRIAELGAALLSAATTANGYSRNFPDAFSFVAN